MSYSYIGNFLNFSVKNYTIQVICWMNNIRLLSCKISVFVISSSIILVTILAGQRGSALKQFSFHNTVHCSTRSRFSKFLLLKSSHQHPPPPQPWSSLLSPWLDDCRCPHPEVDLLHPVPPLLLQHHQQSVQASCAWRIQSVQGECNQFSWDGKLKNGRAGGPTGLMLLLMKAAGNGVVVLC